MWILAAVVCWLGCGGVTQGLFAEGLGAGIWEGRSCMLAAVICWLGCRGVDWR